MALNKKAILLIGVIIIVVGVAVYGLQGSLGSGALRLKLPSKPAPPTSIPKIARTADRIDTNIIQDWQDVNAFRITNTSRLESIFIKSIQMACGGSGALSHNSGLFDNDMELWSNGARVATVYSSEPCSPARNLNLVTPVEIAPRAFRDFKVRFYTISSGWQDGNELTVYVSFVVWRGAREGRDRTEIIGLPLHVALLIYRAPESAEEENVEPAPTPQYTPSPGGQYYEPSPN